MMLAIETKNLHRSYDGLSVLCGVDLNVPQGVVYGILGPNGAGKSTLIHLLLGFLKPTSGSLRVLGEANLEHLRGRLGYLPERLRYHTRFTGREYLRHLGRFSDLREPRLTARVNEELRAVGLLDVADRMISTYSKGMLQRLGVAQALLSDPDILLIDEPTSGLDPAGQREVIDLLSAVRQRGHTIVLTTHFLDEVEQLCDRVGILFRGKLAAEFDVASLRVPGHSVLINVSDLSPEMMQRLQRLNPAIRCVARTITIEPNTAALQAQVLRILLDAAVSIISLEPQSRPLEEIYLRIVRGESVTLDDRLPAPGQPKGGDTLLRELLGQEGQKES